MAFKAFVVKSEISQILEDSKENYSETSEKSLKLTTNDNILIELYKPKLGSEMLKKGPKLDVSSFIDSCKNPSISEVTKIKANSISLLNITNSKRDNSTISEAKGGKSFFSTSGKEVKDKFESKQKKTAFQLTLQDDSMFSNAESTGNKNNTIISYSGNKSKSFS